MDVKEALQQIHGPVGFSSLVHGLLSGDGDNLRRASPVGATLEEAEAKLATVEQAQADCNSDYAYWGYEGEKAAWEAAVNILRAAELVGPENLPDIRLEAGGGVVMDECAKLSRWSRAVLEAARQSADPA